MCLIVVMSQVLTLYLTIHLFLFVYFQIKAFEEKTSAGGHSEPKDKLAVPDAEMKEANEPANKSNDNDTAEPKRKRKGSRGRPRSISTPPTHHMTRRSKSRSKSLSEMDTVKPVRMKTEYTIH